jgi:putative glutamine amidotransferase
MSPLIGVTAYAERTRWGVWDAPAVLVPRSYVDAVAAAGGVPVVLPPLPGVVVAALGRLDGLLLAGGSDLGPQRYGAEPGEHTGPVRPERDAAEAELLAGALDGGLPVLGVCRGMQLMDVARGGSLIQHLPDVVGHAGHAEQPGVYSRHVVKVAGDSALAGILGAVEVEVPSYHHQGIERLGAGLIATAWAPDGTVEALEDPALPFCLGVQWHPEAGTDLSLFRALVAAAGG